MLAEVVVVRYCAVALCLAAGDSIPIRVGKKDFGLSINRSERTSPLQAASPAFAY